MGGRARASSCGNFFRRAHKSFRAHTPVCPSVVGSRISEHDAVPQFNITRVNDIPSSRATRFNRIKTSWFRAAHSYLRVRKRDNTVSPPTPTPSFSPVAAGDKNSARRVRFFFKARRRRYKTRRVCVRS